MLLKRNINFYPKLETKFRVSVAVGTFREFSVYCEAYTLYVPNVYLCPEQNTTKNTNF